MPPTRLKKLPTAKDFVSLVMST